MKPQRNFWLLFASVGASLLGNQFTLIASPWLVMQLTNDPLALGFVLALEGLPRAFFMLLGGAFIDRLHPRRVMLVTDIICFVLAAATAALVMLNAIQLWMLYIFALTFGLVSGIAAPATNSLVPMLLPEKQLQTGNSLIMGITQISSFVGPTIAGILIGHYSSSAAGIGAAFAIDSMSFAISAVLLAMMTNTVKSSALSFKPEDIGRSVIDGMRYLWQDKVLRFAFLLLSVVNFLLMGPLTVGIPLLAEHRLPQGATAFGLLMSSFAGGSLLGYLLAGSLPRPGRMLMRRLILVIITGFGLIMGTLGILSSTLSGTILLALLGLGNGYIAIMLFTWIQARTPSDKIGRVMSLLLFANAGLTPLSQAISGVVSHQSLTLLFFGSGVLVVTTMIIAMFQPELAIFSEDFAIDRSVEPCPDGRDSSHVPDTA